MPSPGRPTVYDEKRCCDVVIKCGKKGQTLAEMASALGVDRATVTDWRNKHPAFSSAVKRGLEEAQAWWERKGREATFGAVPGFNATSWIFNMKNRCADDWKDRHDLTSSDGSMTPKPGLDVSKLPTEVLEAIVAAADVSGPSDD